VRKFIAAVILSCVLLGAGCGQNGDDEQLVLLRVEDDPTVSFRVLFNVGSQNDPPGKEGLAALTASLITEGSTQKHSYEEILELLYPLAADIGEQVDKEVTVFSGRTHVDNLDEYYALFKEVLLEPAFKQEDFERVKTDYLNYVRTSLRYSQDEVLGKEALYEFIFAGTAYEHNEEGHVKSLEAISLDDVKRFYQTHYTQANIVIGLGGGFESGFAGEVMSDFEAALPAGERASLPEPEPQEIEGLHVMIVEKDASSTAISFGFPIDVTRGSKDFYALAMATSWLGEHRNGFSHLYEVIRERRGLNYGDYAYIEHFPYGHRRQFPPPNVPRRQQIFQVWIRPVPNEARVFALRAAMRELEKLIDQGMSKEDFELTRKFLKGYNLHYAPTTTMKLGYALDDRFYDIKNGHWKTYARMLDKLSRGDVNNALKKHFNYENVKIVFITPDAEGLKNTLVNNVPSPITYESEKPAEILEEDKEISTYRLSVKPENVTIVEVEEVFEE
jgi:zinc protease